MSAERRAYVDSSAIVKLVVAEPESSRLRRHVRSCELVTSALALTEVARALRPHGDSAVARGNDLLRAIDKVALSSRLLRAAGTVDPPSLRSLDAIHLATAVELKHHLAELITYDARMADAARALGIKVVAPT